MAVVYHIHTDIGCIEVEEGETLAEAIERHRLSLVEE